MSSQHNQAATQPRAHIWVPSYKASQQQCSTALQHADLPHKGKQRHANNAQPTEEAEAKQSMLPQA
jgi:hypothetical protein